MQRGKGIHTLVLSALFGAICTLMTMVVRIPAPIGGYLNLGDCGVLLSGWVLGPLYGPAAAGIGSMLADLLSGYALYAPATCIVKGCMALTGALVLKAFLKRGRSRWQGRALGGALAVCILVLGYFGYAWLILGQGWAAAATIPGNALQGGAGLLCACLVDQGLVKARAIEGPGRGPLEK